MKRTNIAPEYKYEDVKGTLNMLEKTSFFGSKIVNMENSILLDSRDIIYYQQKNGTQLNYNVELSLSKKTYSISDDKESSSTLIINESQNDFNRNNKTQWTLTINIRNVLRNYIFAQIKAYRIFNGITNEDTKYKSVNTAIKEYIDENIINKYVFSELIMFIKYNQLNNSNQLRYNTNFNKNIMSNEHIFKKFNSELSLNNEELIVNFSQEENSKDYYFDYYFNLKFNIE